MSLTMSLPCPCYKKWKDIRRTCFTRRPSHQSCPFKMTTTTAKARYHSSTTTATRYYSTTNDGQGHINKRGEVMIFSNANKDSATNKHHQHPRNRYHYQSPVINVSLTCYFLVLPFLWRKEGYTSQKAIRHILLQGVRTEYYLRRVEGGIFGSRRL